MLWHVKYVKWRYKKNVSFVMKRLYMFYCNTCWHMNCRLHISGSYQGWHSSFDWKICVPKDWAAFRQLSLHTVNMKLSTLLCSLFVPSHFSLYAPLTPTSLYFYCRRAVLESIFHPEEWTTSYQGMGSKNKTTRHKKYK